MFRSHVLGIYGEKLRTTKYEDQKKYDEQKNIENRKTD